MKEANEPGREYALCGFFTGFVCPNVCAHVAENARMQRRG